jgi:hypothetical protein
MLDCDISNGGCNGGFPLKAFLYVKKNGGQMSTASYSYLGK